MRREPRLLKQTLSPAQQEPDRTLNWDWASRVPALFSICLERPDEAALD